MNLTNAKVSKQLNGNNIFVIFEGIEQAILDAYNTLWQVNCFNGDLEWLNAGIAVVPAFPEQFQRGLFYRHYLKLIAGDKVDHCKQRAKELAEKDWQEMELARVITPSTSLAPIVYTMGTKRGSSESEWQCEKTELAEE